MKKEKPVLNLLPLFVEASLSDEMRENHHLYKGFLHPCPECMSYDFVRGGCEELSCWILDEARRRYEREN